jgi:hypothetical protein
MVLKAGQGNSDEPYQTMTFPCTIAQRSDGRWSIRHVGSDIGTVEVSAGTREEAMEKIRNELRYRLEMCPCTGEAYRNLEIEVVEAGRR